DLIAEDLQIMVSYVNAAHLHGAIRHIVKPGYHLYQSGFRASGSADDTDRLSGFNVKVDILQRKIDSFSRIAYFHMDKINIDVRHGFNRIVFFLHIGNLGKHLGDTVCGRLRDHDHYKDKSNHHQRHQHLHGVYYHACHLSRFHGAEYDAPAADKDHRQHHDIYGKLHDRRVPRHDLFRFCEQIVHILGNPVEFPDLEILSYKGLDHAGRVYILLHGIVQHVILVEHLHEMRMGFLSNKDQRSSQKRNYNQE